MMPETPSTGLTAKITHTEAQIPRRHPRNKMNSKRRSNPLRVSMTQAPERDSSFTNLLHYVTSLLGTFIYVVSAGILVNYTLAHLRGYIYWHYRLAEKQRGGPALEAS